MHLCQRFFQSLKHFSNSIFGVAFSSFSDALLMSSMAVKRRPFKVYFIFGNRKKSHGAMSGEYGGWGIVSDSWAASTRRCFCSKFNNFGTNFAATRFIPKTFEKISWHEPIDMTTSSATSLIVIRRSFITISFTFPRFHQLFMCWGVRGGRHLQRLHGYLENVYTTRKLFFYSWQTHHRPLLTFHTLS